MNHNTTFATTLATLKQLQLPIITAEMLEEFDDKNPITTSHIIISDGVDRVTDFTFMWYRHRTADYVSSKPSSILVSVTSKPMSFHEALLHYEVQVLRSPGSVLKLHSN